MPRDWRALLENMSPVMRLVHLAARQDAFDVESIRGELLRNMRAAYNDELNIQARRVGCNRTGGVREGPILSALNEIAKEHAGSIVNTYNYDLALAIQHIRQEVPSANRYTYAARLSGWNERREKWKNPQIALATEQVSRTRAQQDFVDNNGLREGTARLEPRTAVCPICQGWIARGNVPIYVAMANPGPWHNGCPHGWQLNYGQRGKIDCADLWLGE